MSSTVVVLHGFTGCGAAMDPLTQRLRAGLDDTTVLAPDLAGHGLGPASIDPADYTIVAMASAVGTLVDGPFHLVGYSMGGRVALTLACRRPDRVASLSLIGASAGLERDDERAARLASDAALAAALEADPEAFIDRWMHNPLFATQQRLGAEAWAASRSQRLANDPAGMALSLRMGSTGRMTPLHVELAACRLPVGLIVGALDAKFQGIAADMAAALPSADVITIENAGHAAHIEEPDAAAAGVLATIGRGR